jgi:hypothetical protein
MNERDPLAIGAEPLCLRLVIRARNTRQRDLNQNETAETMGHPYKLLILRPLPKLISAVNLELLKDVSHVSLDGAEADHETFGYLSVVASLEQHLVDLLLARSQIVFACRCHVLRPAFPLWGPLQVMGACVAL